MITPFFLWKNGSEIPGAQWQEQDFEIFGRDGSFQSQVMTPGPANPVGEERTEHTKVHWPTFSATERYNTYRMEWTPDSLCFYFNGKLIRKETDKVEFAKLLDPARAEPSQLRVSVWAGDWAWSGRFDTTAIPADVFVNWIQVFDYTPGTGPAGSNFSLRWRDDFNSFNTNRWWLANWTFSYAVNDYVGTNATAKDGALCIALTHWTNMGTFRPVPPDDNLTPSLDDPLPVDSTPHLLPSRLNLQKFVGSYETTPYQTGAQKNCLSANLGVDFVPNADTSVGKCYVGGTAVGEWLDYVVESPYDALYDVSAEVATNVSGQKLAFQLDGVDLGWKLDVPPLGWEAWQTLAERGLRIPAGKHVFRVKFATGNVNLRSLKLLSNNPYVAVPGRLRAEDYNAFYDLTSGNAIGACKPDDVDKELVTDDGLGCSIGSVGVGEWLEYPIEVSAEGWYVFSLRMASLFTGRTVRISVDGTPVGNIASPSAGWSAFASVPSPVVALTAGRHVLRVEFVNGYVNLHYIDVQAAANLPPVVVSGLSAVAGDATVDLVWNTSIGASTYKVVRGADTVAVVTSTTFHDASVVNGTSYSYVVVAANAAGNAAASAPVTVVPRAPEPPVAPTGLVGSAGNGVVDLLWNAVDGATSYNVQRSLDGTTFAFLASVAGASYSDHAVNNGETYSYRVTALRGLLEGAASEVINAEPRGVAPVAVSGVLATPGNGKVELVWGAVADAEAYTIYRGVGTGALSVVDVVSIASYTDLAVANGQGYRYSVVASNRWGEAPASDVVEATPQAFPDVPSDLTAKAGDVRVELAWTAGANTTGFRLYRALGDGAFAMVADNLAVPSFTDVSVENGKNYSYSVTALNGSLESARSNVVTARPVGNVPDQATGLVATAEDAQVVLSWNNSAGAASYKVMRSTAASPAVQIGSVQVASYTDAPVVNGTTYTYSIVAANEWGDAPASVPVTAHPDFLTPTAPTGLAATAGNGTVSLTWIAGANNRTFRIYRATGSSAAVLLGSSSVPSYLDATATNGVTYSYTVTGINGTKESVPSVAAIAVPDYPTPAVPSSLAATVTSGRVALTWVAGANDVSYRIYRAEGSSAAVLLGASTTSSYVDASVVNGTVYTYAVSGVNGTKESAPSDPVVASPKGDVPSVVTGLVASAGNSTVGLTWNPSSLATIYKVVRGTDTVARVATTSYSDNAVVNGTTYSYSVVASNTWGNAPSSVVVTAKPLAFTASLKALYKAGTVGTSTNGIRPLLQLVNTGSSAVALSRVTMRYWFTNNGSQAASYWCDWAQIGNSNLTGTVKSISPARTGADRYLGVAFKTSAGNLAAGASTGEIQSRFSKSDWSNFTQTDDYSYDATKANSYADWNRATVYVDGALVWGVEP